ncbi:MAG: hypothetical protein B7X99_06810 [Rhizobiales bacterium 17-65-6]|nr:MAG: hypothetical protein B7X99_06810 [Rhizobiales bacterium 17-65-6]
MLVPACVRLTKPVLLTATIEVVPLTIRSAVLATTPVNPLPSPTNRVAVTVPVVLTPLAIITPAVLTSTMLEFPSTIWLALSGWAL